MQRTAPSQQTTSVEDLARIGLTAEQIDSLERLREIYPLIELVDNNLQIEQLRFLRWLHHRNAS